MKQARLTKVNIGRVLYGDREGQYYVRVTIEVPTKHGAYTNDEDTFEYYLPEAFASKILHLVRDKLAQLTKAHLSTIVEALTVPALEADDEA